MIHSVRKSILAYLLVISSCYFNTAYATDHPTIMVSIKPFYNICARVMQSVGTPELLLHNNASPHDYQLKPSDIKLLDAANLVIWGGPELEGYLKKPIENIRPTKDMNLAKIPGLKLLSLRTSTNWEDHEHCSHGHKDCNHNHDHDHAGSHDAQQKFSDAHFWLNPDNAVKIANAIAKRLSSIDPIHARIYKKNAADFAREINTKKMQWQKQLKPMHNKPFIVFHDAYQYFEKSFNLNGAGSITLNPEVPPSVQRIKQIQNLLTEEQVKCIFIEPQFNSKIIDAVTNGLPVYQGTLDPLGREEDIGAQGYIILLDNLTQNFVACGTYK